MQKRRKAFFIADLILAKIKEKYDTITNVYRQFWNIFRKFFSKIDRSILLLLFLMVFFAGFLRLYKLSSFPVGFHIDEAIIGDTAYSLLLTGKDYDGKVLPLSVETFNDYVPAGYHYLTILPVMVFGLTIFATRLPGAIIGALMILPVYFLSWMLFKKKSVALVAALLTALSPWAIVFSRATSEAFVSLFSILIGMVFLLIALEKKTMRSVTFATLFFACSYFFYHTARVFVPLLFFTTVGIYFFPWKKKQLFSLRYFLASFLFLCILSFTLVFLVGNGINRFTQTSIFTNPGTALIMQEQIREDGVLGTPAHIARLFHNKVINYSLTFLSNYFSYFDANMLFITDGKPIIFSVPGVGLLYLIELPFLLIGIISLAGSKKRIYYIPLLWLLLSPVVAALTIDDSPNIRRAIELFPMLDMVAAYGFVVTSLVLRGRIRILFVCCVGVLLLYNSLYFFHQYFVHAYIHRPWDRNNGFGQMVAVINKKASSVDHIVITKSKGGIWPLIVFYSRYNPKVYQHEGSPKDTAYIGFGKYFFVPQACPSLVNDPKYPKGRLLFVEHGEVCKKQQPGKTYQFIYREDGTNAFRIVSPKY